MFTNKKQESKESWGIIKTIEEFKDDVGLIKGFSRCEDNGIRLDTSVAKEDHISHGNKLGIMDGLVRTLRELIENVVM